MVIPEQAKLMTRAEFEAFADHPKNVDRLLERINGEIVEKVPKQLHALVSALLTIAFGIYLRENPIAWVFSEVRVSPPDDALNDRIPDVAVVLKEGRTIDPDEALPYMPDLAIEVQSPGQSDKFMADKADYYLANGARMVWLVYPTKRLVEVLTLDDRHLLTESDTLDMGDLLPNFSLPIKDIFPQN
jgi:Uma2 family endonuclease